MLDSSRVMSYCWQARILWLMRNQFTSVSERRFCSILEDTLPRWSTTATIASRMVQKNERERGSHLLVRRGKCSHRILLHLKLRAQLLQFLQ